jgi:hypothetical protein
VSFSCERDIILKVGAGCDISRAKSALLAKNRSKFDPVPFEQSRSTISWKQTECILGEAVVWVATGKFLVDLT